MTKLRKRRPGSPDVTERLSSRSTIRKARTGRTGGRKGKNRGTGRKASREDSSGSIALGDIGQTGPMIRLGPVTITFGASLRIKMVCALAVGCALIIVGRSVELQLMDGARYTKAAKRQSTLRASVQAKRGIIKDRHGAELAITVDVDSIYAEPRRIDRAQVETYAKKLATILKLPKKKLQKKLLSDRAFVYLRRRVDAQIAKKVEDAKLTGVGLHAEPKRFYSNVQLAAHVLGFTGWDGAGKAGIERRFEAQLRGKSYEMPGVRDARGRRILSEGFVPQAVLEGADVTLTIDRQIQHATEAALAEAVQDNGGKSGVAIVIEPSTGHVLAMASFPTFNPNNLTGTKAQDRKNRAVSMIFEPGSTMKMVTVAAALEEGKIKPSDTIDCEGGKWKVGGRTIGDADHAYGNLSITQIMKVSSNICAAKIGLQLGAQTMHDWLFRFGFGKTTGVGLPGELRGLIRPAERWREIALANIAFGQGIAVTPLQVAQAIATVANGGVLVPPRIVSKVKEKSAAGKDIQIDLPKARRVISRDTASKVAKMMVEVTKKGGTAESAAIPGFLVAGKTGTAQKIDPVTRAYSHSLHVASFGGFVPADRPKVAILVMVDEPKKSMYGGTVAAPAFRKIALNALSALEVFPEDAEAKEKFLAGYRAERPKEAKAAPQAADAQPGGKWLSSSRLEDNSTALLETALSDEAQRLLGFDHEQPTAIGEEARMPDVMGLSLVQVLNRSSTVRCDPIVSGTGVVVKQQPKAGRKIEPGGRCSFELSQERL